MDSTTLKKVFSDLSCIMHENKNYLIELDQQNGDGDLGISMSDGFSAASEYLAGAEESDLGRLLMKVASVFNEAAPSSLGTIMSFALMGMAKELKGLEKITYDDAVKALRAGVEKIMDKADSKPGEKTILDSLCPAIEVLEAGDDVSALKSAAKAAAEGSESTKQMRSVHGRAAYYGDKSIGILDGGSVVGKLIFESLQKTFAQ